MHYISTCRRPMNTKLGRVLTYFERLPSLKPNDSFLTWTTWGYLTVWKKSISTFTKLTTTKRGRVVTSEERLSKQMVKSSPAFRAPLEVNLRAKPRFLKHKITQTRGPNLKPDSLIKIYLTSYVCYYLIHDKYICHIALFIAMSIFANEL